MTRLVTSLTFICFAYVGFAQHLKVSILVVDEVGINLSGVTVSIEGLQKFESVTMSNGVATILLEDKKYQPGMPVTFNVRKEGYQPYVPHQLTQNLPSYQNTLPIKFILRKVAANESVSINGIVEDSELNPLDSAIITILETGFTTTSDAKGTFRLPIGRSFIGKPPITIRVLRSGYRVLDPASISKYYVLDNPTVLVVKMAGLSRRHSLEQRPALLAKGDFYDFNVKGSPHEWFATSRFFETISEDTQFSDAQIDFKRTFVADNRNSVGSFGYGWSHIFGDFLDLKGSTLCEIRYVDVDRDTIIFSPAKGCEYLANTIGKTLFDSIVNLSLEEIISLEKNISSNILLPLNNLEYIGIGLKYVTTLKIIPRGFQISQSPLISRVFNREGKLQTEESPYAEQIKILYGPQEKIEYVEQGNYYMSFDYDDRGLVKSINTTDGERYRYYYDSEKRLIMVKDRSKVNFKYQYNSSNNIVSIFERLWEDEKPVRRKIEYDLNGWIKSISYAGSGKNQNALDYRFFEDKGSSTAIRIKIKQLEENDTMKFTFNKNDDKLIIQKSGWSNPKIYTVMPCGCFPLNVVQGTDTTFYSYNSNGNLLSIINSDSIINFKYDDFRRPYRTFKKSSNGDTLEHFIIKRFDYDSGFQYTFIDSLQGFSFSAIYDPLGSIKLIELRRWNRKFYNVYSDIEPITLHYYPFGKDLLSIRSENERVDFKLGNVRYKSSKQFLQNIYDVYELWDYLETRGNPYLRLEREFLYLVSFYP